MKPWSLTVTRIGYNKVETPKGKRKFSFGGRFCLEECSGVDAGEINFILYICSFLSGGIPFSYVKKQIKIRLAQIVWGRNPNDA